MGKKKENNPNFVINGENDNGTFKVSTERFFVVFKSTTRKVVIVGTISEGLIAVGDKMTLTFANDKTLKDSVRRIEINKKSVVHAVQGESVGIELESTKIKCLRASNDKAGEEMFDDANEE